MMASPTVSALLEHIEGVLVSYAGPMGKYVLKKQKKDLKINMEKPDFEALKKLIEISVEYAVYSPDRKEECKKTLMKSLRKYMNTGTVA